MYICKDCFKSYFPINFKRICVVCGKEVLNSKKIKYLHTDCEQYTYLNGNIFIVNYNKFPQMILNYAKYKGYYEILNELSNIIIEYVLSNKISLKDFVVSYIPLHTTKLNSRGFNQSQIIATNLCENLKLEPINLLQKTIHTKSQRGSKRESRLNNIKDTFRVINKSYVKNRNILLIDDVFTTGATLNEAAKMLKQAGAKEVTSITFARKVIEREIGEEFY